MTLELIVSLNLCIMNFIATGMRYQHFSQILKLMYVANVFPMK